MSVHRVLAPAKVNLGLFLGPTRASDARHEIVTVMQSISLADELVLQDAPHGATEDELHCPGVGGPASENLAFRALGAFRERTRWAAGPLSLSIEKRIPLAAGLGGGSADAAATLRLARHASGLGDEQLLASIAEELGADVPAQVSPGRWLARGAGERLRALPPPSSPFELLVLPLHAELSSGAVYAEADRLRAGREPGALEALAHDLEAAFGHGAPLPAASELLHNDLQRAAASLCPPISLALAQVREAGAPLSILSGSGPTVLGLFAAEARRAGEHGQAPPSRMALRTAERLASHSPPPILARPVGAQFAQPVTYGRVPGA